jgi:toxin ParE1/3/4
LRRLVKRPLAETDLIDIWSYTFEKWGVTQADRYLNLLNAQILKMVTRPLLGKSRHYLRPGFRSVQIERHVIFYRFSEDEFEIVRVLHDSMEPEHHSLDDQ